MVYLLELKSPHGKLTKRQQEAVALGWPVRVCDSVEEAIRIVTGTAHPTKARVTYGGKST